jgi:hypothetical protein
MFSRMLMRAAWRPSTAAMVAAICCSVVSVMYDTAPS